MASQGLVTSATKPGPVRGGATVAIEDSLPATPPAATPAVWWQDPWKLGLVALAGVVFLTVLIPPRSS